LIEAVTGNIQNSANDLKQNLWQ